MAGDLGQARIVRIPVCMRQVRAPLANGGERAERPIDSFASDVMQFISPELLHSSTRRRRTPVAKAALHLGALAHTVSWADLAITLVRP
jgi:hypothetical protein